MKIHAVAEVLHVYDESWHLFATFEQFPDDSIPFFKKMQIIYGLSPPFDGNVKTMLNFSDLIAERQEDTTLKWIHYDQEYSISVQKENTVTWNIAEKRLANGCIIVNNRYNIPLITKPQITGIGEIHPLTRIPDNIIIPAEVESILKMVTEDVRVVWWTEN